MPTTMPGVLPALIQASAIASTFAFSASPTFAAPASHAASAAANITTSSLDAYLMKPLHLYEKELSTARAGLRRGEKLCFCRRAPRQPVQAEAHRHEPRHQGPGIDGGLGAGPQAEDEGDPRYQQPTGRPVGFLLR